MIDLHSHILPGLDDGPKNMDEALEMCRVAQADGIQTIVASPHHRSGIYENSQANILPALESLQQALKRDQISIKVLPGVDILIHPEVITFLEQNPLLLIGGRYVLMELPNHSIPPRIPDFFFKMRLRGYIPIITHPERNHMVQRDPEVLAELVKVGALFQVTAMSLTGEFGEAAHESVTRLIRSGLVHSIATDAHSPRRRPPVLSKARQFLEEMIGRDQAAVVMDQVPEKILRGEVVEGGQITESPRRRPSLLSRLFKRKI